MPMTVEQYHLLRKPDLIAENVELSTESWLKKCRKSPVITQFGFAEDVSGGCKPSGEKNTSFVAPESSLCRSPARLSKSRNRT